MSTLQDLVVKIGIDDREVDKSTSALKDKLAKTWSGIEKAAAVAGAAVGAVLVTSLAGAMQAESATDQLAASVGAFGPEAERLGDVAGDLYADAWGASMAEAAGAVGAVVSSVDGMRSATGEDVQDVTAKVMALAQAFEIDVPRAAQVAGQVVRSGLAVDATHALDLLTVSLQKVPAAVRGDLLDALDEYGPFLTSIGITGEKAFGLLVKAAGDGMYGIDKTGDALKEFTIRATDMSTASKVGFDILGMSQQQMAGRLLAGGETAAAAFDQIVAGLLSVQDPVAQSQAALALFGTPLEDLSVSEIPQFLGSLQEAQSGLGDVAGAADQLGKTLSDNAQTRWETFKRATQQALVEELDKALPSLQRVLDFLIKHSDVVVPLVTVLGTLAAAIYVISLAMKAWTAIQWLLNIAMMANPIGLIIIAIVALVAGILLLWHNSEGFRKFFIGLWEHIWGFLKAIGGWFAGPFVDFFVNAWNWIVNAGKKVLDWFLALPGKMRDLFWDVANFITTPFRWAFNKVSELWNNTVGRLSWTVPGWVPLIGGKSISAPKLPTLAAFHGGGIVPGRGGDVPINASGGEGVFTRDQMRNLAPVGSAGGRRPVLASDGTRMMDLLVEVMREAIRAAGADPDEFLAPGRI